MVQEVFHLCVLNQLSCQVSKLHLRGFYVPLIGITLPTSQHLDLIVRYPSLSGRSGSSNSKAVCIILFVIQLEFRQQGIQG